MATMDQNDGCGLCPARIFRAVFIETPVSFDSL
jgi:hypothetical protein